MPLNSLVKERSMTKRSASISRHTKETQIDLTFCLDGTGSFEGTVQNGFLTHMLELLAKHGNFDITIEAKGDTHYDDHHLIEDVAISFGLALKEALGDKAGIKRYGQRILPLDETLCLCALDLSGRYAFETDYAPVREKVNDFSTEMVPHFFESLASNAMISLHLQLLNPGRNEHHRIETMFKSFARALKEAVELDPTIAGQIPSSKGSL